MPGRASPVPLEGGSLINKDNFPAKYFHLQKEVLDEVVALHHELLHAEPALVGLLDPQVAYPELLVVAAEGGRRDHYSSVRVNPLAPLDESEAGPLLQTILLLQELLEFQ